MAGAFIKDLFPSGDDHSISKKRKVPNIVILHHAIHSAQCSLSDTVAHNLGNAVKQFGVQAALDGAESMLNLFCQLNWTGPKETVTAIPFLTGEQQASPYSITHEHIIIPKERVIGTVEQRGTSKTII